ncbi:MAG: MurR/RpiR family transcriptional regulator, partial [Mesorhizobium sp.]
MSGARTSPGERVPRKRGRSLAALGHTKPQTYEELRAVLSSGTVHFPKRMRQVAIFLW